MIKTVSKNVGKGWAIASGFFFVFCAVIKFAAVILPNYAVLFSASGGAVSYFQMSALDCIEIFAYASLALITFSCRRTNASLLSIAALGLIIFDNASERVWNFIYSIKSNVPFDVISEICFLVFTVCSLLCLLFIILEISVNLSTEKGAIAIKIFATLAIVLYILGYGGYILGDILEFFTSSRFGGAIGGTDGMVEDLVVPIMDNVKQLISCGGILFFCVWMAIRRKVEEIYVNDKITDEELFKDVVVDPNMIKISEPEPEPVKETEAEAAEETEVTEKTPEEI